VPRPLAVVASAHTGMKFGDVNCTMVRTYGKEAASRLAESSQVAGRNMSVALPVERTNFDQHKVHRHTTSHPVTLGVHCRLAAV